MITCTTILDRVRHSSLAGFTVLLCVAGLSASTRADFSTSNFTASQGFNALSGYNLTGPKSVTGQGFAIGVQFTVGSTSNVAFNSAQLALAYRAGTNALDVSLMTDLKGVPSGTALETIRLTNVTATPGITTATSILHPILAAGVSYWLVATYAAADTNIAWLFNSTGQSTHSAYRSDSSSTLGSWIGAPSLTDPGFAIAASAISTAAVPAPPSGVLVGIGGLGLFWGHRIQRRRSDLRPRGL